MREQFPKALYFRDWRELFAKEAGNFESCNIGHSGSHARRHRDDGHAAWKTRVLPEAAVPHALRVAPSGGGSRRAPEGRHPNGHPAPFRTANYRQAVQLIQSGTIGPVHTVYSWCTSTRERAQRPDSPEPGGSDSAGAGLGPVARCRGETSLSRGSLPSRRLEIPAGLRRGPARGLRTARARPGVHGAGADRAADDPVARAPADRSIAGRSSRK